MLHYDKATIRMTSKDGSVTELEATDVSYSAEADEELDSPPFTPEALSDFEGHGFARTYRFETTMVMPPGTWEALTRAITPIEASSRRHTKRLAAKAASGRPMRERIPERWMPLFKREFLRHCATVAVVGGANVSWVRR